MCRSGFCRSTFAAKRPAGDALENAFGAWSGCISTRIGAGKPEQSGDNQTICPDSSAHGIRRSIFLGARPHPPAGAAEQAARSGERGFSEPPQPSESRRLRRRSRDKPRSHTCRKSQRDLQSGRWHRKSRINWLIPLARNRRSVACPANWRGAAATPANAVFQMHRGYRNHDDCVADRGTSHTPTPAAKVRVICSRADGAESPASIG